MVLYGMVWLISLYCGMVWYGMVYGMAVRSVLRYGILWLIGLYTAVWYGMADWSVLRYGMVWLIGLYCCMVLYGR